MKNNLYLFKRLYANISRYGEQQDSYVFKQTLVKILEKIILEINLKMNLAEGQKYSELRRISQFLSPYITREFPEWIEKNEIKIESPIDLTNAILDFNKLNDGASYLGSGFENPVLTFDELLPVVEKGITNASRVYYSEQEIVLNNRELNIPKNSQLFFIGKDEVGRKRESNRDELIEKYNLKELYKVYFVDRQQIQKYRDFWLKKEEEKFNQKIETGKQDLEIKKSQVTDNLIDYFIQHSIDTVIDKVNKEILSYELGSLEFYDSTKDDYEEMNWVNIPLVNELFSKYTEIVEKSWEEIIENKSVNEVNLYSFNVFQDDANRKLKTYFEQNRDKYEELDNYRNTKGRPSLQLTIFEYDMLKSLDDYQDLPEWIDYKELSKIYLNKMGVEIYRYYNKKDLPLISYYKQGGSVLLAPNGKPSKLTTEQYELVRSSEFKTWFGDWEKAYETQNYDGVSKVVDTETSEPMVVYHGTNNKFNEFTYESARKSDSGLEPIFGFYFSVKKQTKNNSYGKYISSFFLNIKNNLYVDYGGNAESLPKNKLIKLIGKRKVISDFYLKDGKEWIITKVTKEYNKNGENKTMSSQNQLHWIWEAYYSKDKTIEEFQKEVTKIFGLDGYYMETLGNENFIAIHPEQIKLADGTNTTFDGNNPDIRFDEGGKVDLYEYNRALKEVSSLIPQISHKIIHENNLPHNEETIIKLNKEIIEKVKRGDDKTLDLMWDIAWSLSLKHSINVITYYHKKYKNGGETNELIIGKTYSGKQVRDIVSKYESQEGTDMQGFAISYIKLKDNYILDYVDIQKLIENDIDLKAFISDEYNPNENIEYDYIRQPILLGTNEYSKKQNTVLDGFHRVLQALYNKDKKIVAFINLEFH